MIDLPMIYPVNERFATENPLIFYYVDHLEMTIFNSWLVVQCAHLEEYEFVNGKDYPPYIVENKIHV